MSSSSSSLPATATSSPQQSQRSTRRTASFQEDPFEELDHAEAVALVDSKVKKFFAGHGWFEGIVDSYDSSCGLYRIVYDDGDEEELNHSELLTILVVKNNQNPSSKPGESSNGKKSHRDASDDDDDDASLTEHSHDDDDDDDDDDSLVVEIDYGDNWGLEEMGERMTTAPRTPKASKKSGKRKTKVVTPSPAKTRKGRSPSSSSSSKSPSSSSLPPPQWNAKSVAVRGLPRGSLARCSKTGFTIRALESVLPLSGSTTTLTDKSKTAKRQSKFGGMSDPSNDLPCRMLIVAAPNDSEEWFPSSNFVGKTFANAVALHRALNHNKLATFQMEPVADPPFSSWNFTQARLVSAGLVSSSNENQDDNDDQNRIIVVQMDWDGKVQISSEIRWYEDLLASIDDMGNNEEIVWAILEGNEKDLPAVLLSAPQSLVGQQEAAIDEDEDDEMSETSDNENEGATDEQETNMEDEDQGMFPPLSTKNSKLRLPASLLQKAMRRGSMLSSPQPLLEACSRLLHREHEPVPGSTLAFLRAIWGCMIVDASPFDDGEDCLGLPGLLALSMIAKADPKWTLPPLLRRTAVTAALRTARTIVCQPWVGFVHRDDNWWELEKDEPSSFSTQKAQHLRNIIRADQCSVGSRLAWGKWNKFVGDTSAAAALAYLNRSEWKGSHLPYPPPASEDESRLLLSWEEGHFMDATVDKRFQSLDDECRLAAVEPSILPHTIIMLQALLASPPTSWKKHSLPSLCKQVRKLVSEANPRLRERVQLARLATWGKEKQPQNAGVLSCKTSSELDVTTIPTSKYTSYKEVVTPTGCLSTKELELVNCFEAIQRLQIEIDGRAKGSHMLTVANTKPTSSVESGFHRFRRVQAGPPLTEFDGRIAFILAFAFAIEVEVIPDPSFPVEKETVSAMFCGTPEEPLLVQRIGKARQEGKDLATSGGVTSGAMAVPSLGYVQRGRTKDETMLMEAAELAVADHWKGGLTMPLPLPPAGIQWEVSSDENTVTRTVELIDEGNGKKRWQFTIAGISVGAFDGRPVISPCALDLDDDTHKAVTLESVPERCELLQRALYISDEVNEALIEEDLSGKRALDAMEKLHALAEADRIANKEVGLNEGIVYDWLTLAAKSPLPSRTWRDVLLAIRTRDKEHVVLGKGVCPDGTGTARDMTEGVLLRVFHVLEMLYPSALHKDAAMRFRVRPRGAAYHHLLSCLERLGTGDLPKELTKERPARSKIGDRGPKRKSSQPSRTVKRPRRCSAIASSRKTRGMLAAEVDEVVSVASSDEELTARDEKTGGYWDDEASDYLPVPEILTPLWPHQEASVSKVTEGVKMGRRGYADASAVGAGKTLTALGTLVRLAKWIAECGRKRHGVLIMLPTKALIREWLMEIASHTKGFHVIEQREDGALFSLTYAKSHPPIDANSIVISTLDRVCRHPFVRQAAWDFVIVDEWLAVQNAAAKRNPSAWRQIEVSKCGVLMLSATFFRSKYDQLFYMIRMLRSPMPPTLPWLPATIHEHIVCQVPETDRSWTMKGEMVPLAATDLQKYRNMIEAFKRKQVNEPGEVDGRKLWTDLESFLRKAYEGRASKTSYRQTSVMSDAFSRVSKGLLRKGRRPLIFADTSHEADFLLRALRASGLEACTWSDITSNDLKASSLSKSNIKASPRGNRVIVAVKTVEGQGINMQHHADVIICRPTPGDHLEQMKGRVDRPGQSIKDLQLIVITAEHTIEEAKLANIRLAGNFFREYIAPVATKYRERIDLEATLSAGGKNKLKKGTVSGAWKRSLESAGQSGAFAQLNDDDTVGTKKTVTTVATTVSIVNSDNWSMAEDEDDVDDDEKDDKLWKEKAKTNEKEDSKYKPLNKVKRNKGDPAAVRQAKLLAKEGFASIVVRSWLYPPKPSTLALTSSLKKGGLKPLPKESPMRFSDTTPPVVMDRETIIKAVTHLSQKDPKMAALIARVGPDALANDCGAPKAPTQARLFDRCIRAITFTMVSVDAGNSFLRRLAIKIGVCLERKDPAIKTKLLRTIHQKVCEGSDGYNRSIPSPNHLLQLLLDGHHNELKFTSEMLRELVNDCEIVKGKRTGYPHLCGVTFPCGKNDDHRAFLAKARAAAAAHTFNDEKTKGAKTITIEPNRELAAESTDPVSAGFSNAKAAFIISLVEDFESGKISGEKIARASDRQAAKMLMELKGIGDWCVGVVLMNFLNRADIMLFGDLTVRNYLNDLYDIHHHTESETLLESAADFADTAINRNKIDEVAQANGWSPYRSVVCLLMYHLQEENLVLL